jgi:hypothetical protein
MTELISTQYEQERAEQKSDPLSRLMKLLKNAKGESPIFTAADVTTNREIWRLRLEKKKLEPQDPQAADVNWMFEKDKATIPELEESYNSADERYKKAVENNKNEEIYDCSSGNKGDIG